MFSLSSKSFKIFHGNVRSLNKNYNHLLAHLQNVSHRYDLILLTETWLCSESDQLFQIPGYEAISLNRSGRGGGIRVYALEGLITNCYTEFTAIYNTHESIFLRISLKNAFSFVVGCIYRPPSCSIPLFCEYLHNSLLSNENILRSNCILIVDFNLDLLKIDQYLSIQTFSDLMTEGGFNQLISEPTRVNNDGLAVSLLDHIWVNFDKINYSGLVNSNFTDHIPIEIHLKAKVDNYSVIKRFRDFSHENRERFDTEKSELFYNYNLVTNDPNTETFRFLTWLNKVLNKYFPIRTKNLSNKKLRMPWLTRDIMKLIDKKHKLFIAVKRNLFSYQAYRAYCNILKLLITKSRSIYMKRKFNSVKHDSKKIWQSINSLLGRSTNSSSQNYELETSTGNTLNDHKEIAEHFNNYFNNIPVNTQSKLGLSINNYDHLIPFNECTLNFSFVTKREISSVINKLNNKGGSVELPIKVIKYLSNEIASILEKIFNLCIQKGTYPDAFKIAKIIPLHKAGKRTNVSNYRPISLLPIFNKIFEKLLYRRIIKFFDDNNLISDNQFGFRKSRDTQQATIKLIYEILPHLGTNNRTVGVFLDFSKAFDTVSHQLLSQKLYKYGVRGLALKLIESYLSNRQHFVSIGSTESSIKNIPIGVPQGSVLGPLLFTIYTNDLNYLFQNDPLILYADDTTFIVRHNNPVYLNFYVNFLMYKLSDWCKFNKLALNSNKTKWMYFTYRINNIPTLYIDGVEIEKVNVLKYLGFHIDSRLNHKFHIRFLVAKLRRYCYISLMTRKYLTHSSSKLIFYSLVQSLISYGLLIYGGTLLYGSSALVLSRKYDKIVFNLFSKRNETLLDIKAIYKRNKILNLHDLYKCKCSTALFKIINENYCSFLLHTVNSLLRNRMRETRHNNEYYLPVPTTKSIRLNFLYRAITMWNELDSEFKNLPTSKQFEKAIKKKYLNSY